MTPLGNRAVNSSDSMRLLSWLALDNFVSFIPQYWIDHVEKLLSAYIKVNYTLTSTGGVFNIPVSLCVQTHKNEALPWHFQCSYEDVSQEKKFQLRPSHLKIFFLDHVLNVQSYKGELLWWQYKILPTGRSCWELQGCNKGQNHVLCQSHCAAHFLPLPEFHSLCEIRFTSCQIFACIQLKRAMKKKKLMTNPEFSLTWKLQIISALLCRKRRSGYYHFWSFYSAPCESSYEGNSCIFNWHTCKPFILISLQKAKQEPFCKIKLYFFI